MLPYPELHKMVLEMAPNKRRMYGLVLTATVGAVATVCALLLAGASVGIAKAVVNTDLSDENLWAVAIMPGFMAYLFVAAGANLSVIPGESKRHNVWVAARGGFKRGILAGFVIIFVLHFLGQLLMARAIYGSLEYTTHLSYYCNFYPLVYGVLFAIPVGLTCALFYAYVVVSSHMVYALMKEA